MSWRILSARLDRADVLSLLDRRSLLDEGSGRAAESVGAIILRVKTEGDQALIGYAKEFDGVSLKTGDLALTSEEIACGAAKASAELQEAIGRAAANIRRFHEGQRRPDYWQLSPGGSLLGQRYIPLFRVGVYIPGGAGGLTPLISTVLMNVIPAQTAGVDSIFACTPPGPGGVLAPGLLYAFSLLGVTEVYRAGGAQAIAAMAYGTATIRAADKIVGPGNRYVTEAKRQVFGRVGIDMLAGPSEVAIIADATADPAYIAADLSAQAEHDPEAGAVLFTPHRELAEAVAVHLEAETWRLPRSSIVLASLTHHGGAVITEDLEEALALAEHMAPEHLEIMTAQPLQLAGRIRNAGAVFIGGYSPEALGDYIAGTNHVLPTNATARFASGLGVDDFLRRVSLINYARADYFADAPHAARMAEEEQLAAHARSLRIREQRRQDGT
jgi:histidinol dehydrogenase